MCVYLSCHGVSMKDVRMKGEGISGPTVLHPLNNTWFIGQYFTDRGISALGFALCKTFLWPYLQPLWGKKFALQEAHPFITHICPLGLCSGYRGPGLPLGCVWVCSPGHPPKERLCQRSGQKTAFCFVCLSCFLFFFFRMKGGCRGWMGLGYVIWGAYSQMCDRTSGGGQGWE